MKNNISSTNIVINQVNNTKMENNSVMRDLGAVNLVINHCNTRRGAETVMFSIIADYIGISRWNLQWAIEAMISNNDISVDVDIVDGPYDDSCEEYYVTNYYDASGNPVIITVWNATTGDLKVSVDVIGLFPIVGVAVNNYGVKDTLPTDEEIAAEEEDWDETQKELSEEAYNDLCGDITLLK